MSLRDVLRELWPGVVEIFEGRKSMMEDEDEILSEEDNLLLDLGVHPSGEKMRPGDIDPRTGQSWDPFARPDAEG